MKLLVTGGAGFIGSNFIQYWFNKYPDDKIINLDLLTYAGNTENLAGCEKYSGYTFVHGDIADKKLVLKVMEGVDAVINFAAETHVDRSINDSMPFVHTNILGTHTLLEAACALGNIRFHHVSTDEVFGTLGPTDPSFNENTPYNPRSPYSATKAGGDHLVRAYFYTHNLPITISNCANNYGPYQFPEKLHALFITNILEGKPVGLYGDGMQIRDWLYVVDHCSAIETILRQGKIGESYCVAGGDEIPNLEIAKKIISLLGVSEDVIQFVVDRPGHDRRYSLNDSKLRLELGWKPEKGFEEGMKETVAWYKNNTAWWKKLKK